MKTVNESQTVYVVDDDAAVRDAVVSLLKSAGHSAEQYATAEQLLSAVNTASAGCVVADVRMPGIGGLGLQRAMLEKGLHLPILFITGYADVPTAVGAMKAGAVDFLEKPFKDDRLLECIREALRRDSTDRSRRGRATEASSRLGRLTKRERDILDRVLAGKSSREIAQEIFRTEKTVEFHRRNILRKLGVRKTIQVRELLEQAAGSAGASLN